MKAVVFSHKECWRSDKSPTGWATDGGFPFQIDNFAANLDKVFLIVPEIKGKSKKGSVPITNKKIQIRPIKKPPGKGIWRKIWFPFWFIFYLPVFLKYTLTADFIHAIIPGDVGTVGIFMSHLTAKSLLLRYAGNWYRTKTRAERLWKMYMEKFASPKRIVLATGGGNEPPSKNNYIYWIFSTSISESEILSQPRKYYGILKKEPVLIHVGRQTESKGTDLIIKSIKILKDKGYQAYLKVIGDGKFLPYLKELAKQLNIESQIVFEGKLSHNDVIRILRTTDILVFPSKTEGFPKAVIEAMSQANVVISTPVSVLETLIPQSKAGLLLKHRDEKEISNHIEYLILHQKTFLEMAANAISFSKQYTLESWRNELGKYIKQLKVK